MLTAIALIHSVQAAECVDLDRERFRTLLVDSQNAVDRGDLGLLKTVLGEVERDVPCMDFAPPPRQWAELMVVVAIANHADGENWKSALGAALRIRPGIDRGVGRSHPIYAWEPSDPGTPRPYEGDNQLYVDGRLSTQLPPEGGWYLIQKTDGEYWETRWQRTEPVSSAWAEEPVDRPPELFWQLGGGVQGGMVHVTQLTEQQTAEGWKPYGSRFHDIPLPTTPEGQRYSRPGWGVTFDAKIAYAHLGVRLVGGALWNLAPGMRNGRLSVIYDSARGSLGGGLSLHDVFLVRRPAPGEPREPLFAESETHVERFYHLEGSLRTRGPLELETTLVAGFHSLVSYNGILDVSLTFRRIRLLGGHPRVGGRLTGSNGRFVWADGDGLRLLSASMSATTHITLRFGKDYR